MVVVRIHVEQHQTERDVARLAILVPEEFQDDPIYAKPSERQQDDAKAAKQARRKHRASMAAAAKANQDRRGRDVQDESRPTPKKARK
ncbi:hypothetical protein F442_19755 [Phytophthora nicotianae P10297]|uniref:Uncharacterized protein n=2 Tax=Phytophthora nicotianae TaxID=4792 RepID=W2Y9G8_PHYNI|nr:hypothetical protein F444_19939 [Phytophthora nicotianae P1976]ETP31372.1 hypothetical protein F442_19755 [Phytophthora nicotianae P10297]